MTCSKQSSAVIRLRRVPEGATLQSVGEDGAFLGHTQVMTRTCVEYVPVVEEENLGHKQAPARF